jgi:hypothetical protein
LPLQGTTVAQSYEVADGAMGHRSSSSTGCRLFIVD